MSQPWPNAGNALEISRSSTFCRAICQAVACWRSAANWLPKCCWLATWPRTIDHAAYNGSSTRLEQRSGRRLLRRMIRAQGGPADLLEAPNRHLDRAPHVTELLPDQAGIVQSVNVRELGLAVVELGGGRRRASDSIDPAVGLEAIAGPGQAVDRHRALLKIHARKLADADKISAALRRAFVIGPHPAKPQALVAERLRPRT
jgi:thymidine phosphorylase